MAISSIGAQEVEYLPSSKAENANILAELEKLDTHTLHILKPV